MPEPGLIETLEIAVPAVGGASDGMVSVGREARASKICMVVLASREMLAAFEERMVVLEGLNPPKCELTGSFGGTL
jgi:hypothetical protein